MVRSILPWSESNEVTNRYGLKWSHSDGHGWNRVPQMQTETVHWPAPGGTVRWKQQENTIDYSCAILDWWRCSQESQCNTETVVTRGVDLVRLISAVCNANVLAPAGQLEFVTMNQSRCSDRGQRTLKGESEIKERKLTWIADKRFYCKFDKQK